ncbi:hypothetical protein GIB67_020220 [Kingdonia uniflora]|uniref:non-specific serine/threonine protein kinase n=1 Tax=Kingdonia uniflora TaxID=39325 RepID=A0A7J7P4E4_9MAGN|nr:hypothetical protein GIB67_020220 [Kingdonia uniflora]
MFDHPLLPKFRGEIVTDVIVGLGIDYCPGGDLRTLLERQTKKMLSYDNISGNTTKETFDQILEKEPNLVGDQTALIDLIAKLLKKDPLERITLEGIKSHRFFEGVDWETILDTSRPPYIPTCENIIMEETEKIDVVSFVRECYLADAMEDIEIGKTAKETSDFVKF